MISRQKRTRLFCINVLYHECLTSRISCHHSAGIHGVSAINNFTTPFVKMCAKCTFFRLDRKNEELQKFSLRHFWRKTFLSRRDSPDLLFRSFSLSAMSVPSSVFLPFLAPARTALRSALLCRPESVSAWAFFGRCHITSSRRE